MGKKTTSSGNELPFQYDLRTIRIVYPAVGPEASPNNRRGGNDLIGEVRVKVKLTNEGDEIMVRRGLLTPDQIRTYEADALVYTGPCDLSYRPTLFGN